MPLNSGLRYLTLTAASVAVVVTMTWPLGRVTEPSIPASDDANFSIWRLAWVAHKLPEDPAGLFDANIFHPEKGTLALSDAMLLVGTLGVPLFRAGVNPAVAHNLLLIAAIVLSMVCAFALARRLTGSDPAAWLAAIAFGLAPYRFAHIGHLELQWTMWMPLAMLTLHRAIEQPGVGRATLFGATLAAQTLSSIYYGVFLVCYAGIAWLALVPFERRRKRIAMTTTAAIVPLLVVVAIYGPPYAETRARVGERRAEEVQMFSAVPADYLRVPQENRWRGAPSSAPAPDERSLFPGVTALALAAVSLIPPVSRLAVLYLGLGAAAFDLSLGVNGVLFPLLQTAFTAATSLRSPARFGVLVLLSLSMLAAMGAVRVFGRWPKAMPAVTLALTLVSLAEYWSGPLPVRTFDARPSEAHAWLAQNRPGSVTLELPAPTPKSLWLHESVYQVRSINHWQPLVNGYSAFPPQRYEELINIVRAFPQRHVIEALRERQVKFVLINREFYTAEDFEWLMNEVRNSTRLWPEPRVFGEGIKQVVVVEVKPED